MADRDSFTGSSTSLDLPERHMTSFKAATVPDSRASLLINQTCEEDEKRLVVLEQKPNNQ